MHINQNKSVTVGVIAHNNSADIIYLLRSILKQKGRSFLIDEIIVISDGSSDNTVEKVKKYSQKYPLVKIIKGAKLRGKAIRTQQIFSIAQSKYICIFSGNVILYKNNVLESMVQSLNETQVALISCRMQPITVKGLKANIIKNWYQIQNSFKETINHGDSVYNFQDDAFGIRASHAKSIVFPREISTPSPYLYLTTKAHNLKFRLVSRAIVLFQTAQTYGQYIANMQDARTEIHTIIPLFGKNLHKQYHLPFKSTLKTVAISVLKNPLNIFTVIIFGLFNLIPFNRNKKISKTMWNVTSSHKRRAHSY